MEIIQKFIIEQQNGTQIKSHLKYQLGVNLNIETIYKILKWFRHVFAYYIKDNYRLNKLGKRNRESNISIEESLFTHISGEKIQIV